ncbi:hypothetical protein PV328_011339 [Microctonus aethiopoides]|uniref:F-box domain-containing protein n=1 Tax=Microctonus aethiopoides TaxID=144406 RepID=A0AA39C551_9HYME|nr:hypothetical protein PV328_011339 [Microctonus aethiopoides]
MAENNCDDENVKVERMKLSEGDNQNLSINDLPEECLLEIFSWLHLGELLQVEKVCERWESLCEQLWKAMKRMAYYKGRWSIDHVIWNEIADTKTDVNHIKKLLERCGKYITYFRTSNLSPENPPNITQNLLAIVPQLCKNLTHIQIVSNDLSSVDIHMIAKNLENLIELEIRGLDGKLELDFCKILENNKNLKMLKISSKPDENLLSSLTGKFLQYLSPDVEKIYMDQQYNRHLSYFKTAFRKFKRLQLFKCGGIFDCAMMQALTKNRSLIKLSLSTATFKSMTSINMLGNLVNLKKLNLSFVQELEDDNLIHISNNCKQLEALCIDECNRLTDKGIISIVNLPNLQSLNMRNLDNITDESIGNLSSESLGRLQCDYCKITNEGVIKLIKNSRTLWFINLQNTLATKALYPKIKEEFCTRSYPCEISIKMGENDYESFSSPTYQAPCPINDESDEEEFLEYYF